MPYDLIAEAAQMPDGAIRFAGGTGFVTPPRELDSLLQTVRTQHKTEFAALNAALDRRFNQPDAVWMGVFRAAAEMALMEEVGGTDLQPGDRRRLRSLWEALLGA
jgi:hypothetical protein